ncbi:MAG TPA: hypothetical protein VNK43_07410 [Gemmatimonadales bacterium]|nr:hypothetical protein [Gemmatimonadales bacterium]
MRLAASFLPLAGQQGPESQLSFHGFLTQAYARADGGQYLGIDEHGTTDYRTAALQLRYDVSPRDNFVAQASHERYGHSPIQSSKSDIALDWLFFQHHFGDAASVRLGRVKIPWGIYNEVRDVGTLLPLYRPPVSLYGEQLFTTEAVDGMVVGHRGSLGGEWSLEADIYYGGWRYLQHDGATEATAHDGLGGQLWLGLPADRVRLGFGAARATVDGFLLVEPGAEDEQTGWIASLDAERGPLLLQGELSRITFGAGDLVGWVVLARAAVSSRLGVVAQAEVLDLDLTVPDPGGSAPLVADVTVHRDLAVGLRYLWRSTVVLKAEAHWYRGYGREDRPTNVFSDPPAELRYGILSVSTSF